MNILAGKDVPKIVLVSEYSSRASVRINDPKLNSFTFVSYLSVSFPISNGTEQNRAVAAKMSKGYKTASKQKQEEE